MKNACLVCCVATAAVLFQISCDKKKDKAPTEKPPAPSAENAEEKKAKVDTARRTGKSRAKFSWAELQTWDIKDEISPPGATAPVEPAEEGGEEQPTLSFSRLAGGNGAFCGALRAGPLRCWGDRDTFKKGAFADVAVTDSATCGVTTSGSVECVGFDAPSVTDAKRIAGAGDDLCLLRRTGAVSCFATGQKEPLVPPAGLQAKYIAVSNGTACAADTESHLRCWGNTAVLSLPDKGPAIRDLALGEGFVCYLNAERVIACHGAAPKAPAGEFVAVSAGYSELCGITDDGKAICTGDVEATFEGVERLAVGANVVCALDQEGRVDCKGTDSAIQLNVPREQASKAGLKSAGALSSAEFAEFLELFPEARLPHSFNRDSSFEVGDRLPMKFAPLFEASPNDYRTGVRLPVASGGIAVTLLHLPTGLLELHTFKSSGEPANHRTIAGSARDAGNIQEAHDGTAVQTLSVKAVESEISADKVVATTYVGEQTTYYVKEHTDGSRPVSRIRCNITGTKAIDAIGKAGDFVRKSAEVLPARSTTDAEGCGTAWPMGG